MVTYINCHTIFQRFMQSTIFNKKNIKDQIHIHEPHISKSSLDTHIFTCTFLNYSFTLIKPNFTRYSVSPEGHPAPLDSDLSYPKATLTV